ncbi:MAG: hypothetical protein ACRD0K_11100 [Egibacteraceae bacterium]
MTLVAVGCGRLEATSPAAPPAQAGRIADLRAPAQEPSEREDAGEVFAQCLDPSAAVTPLPAGDAAAQVAEITQRVEAMRGLALPDDAASPEFVSQAEMGRRITAEVDTAYEPEEADTYRRIYAGLGALPPDIDLRQVLTALLASGTVGFYETETNELVVATADPSAPLTPLAQTALAHELTHAVTDAALGIPDDLIQHGPADASLAALSLVEGDAVLTQERFASTALTWEDQLAILDDPVVGQAQRQLDSVPYVLAAGLAFPYAAGPAFVCQLFQDGGYPAVDAAYRDLPTTTAQILFPERYAAREGAVDPRDPGALGAPWQPRPTETLGAADLLWLFEAPGDDRAAALRDPFGSAADWAGGEAHLWTDGPRSAMGIALADRGVGELCDAVADWYDAAFPADTAVDTQVGEVLARDGITQAAVLRCGGPEVRLGIAPDLATARALAA